MRTQRLVDISQTFIADPPSPDRPRPSRGKTTVLVHSSDGRPVVRQVQYPPTPVSHVPGCGPYALDSYRIFCTPGEEWKHVRPTDKELVKYLVSCAPRLWGVHSRRFSLNRTPEMALGRGGIPKVGSRGRPCRIDRPPLYTRLAVIFYLVLMPSDRPFTVYDLCARFTTSGVLGQHGTRRFWQSTEHCQRPNSRVSNTFLANETRGCHIDSCTTATSVNCGFGGRG